jgi:hypothetical protein
MGTAMNTDNFNFWTSAAAYSLLTLFVLAWAYIPT